MKIMMKIPIRDISSGEIVIYLGENKFERPPIAPRNSETEINAMENMINLKTSISQEIEKDFRLIGPPQPLIPQ